MNKYFLFSILLSFVLLFSCQKDQLSKKEKTEDFLYLYETLEANYAYFDLAKRKSGEDWLARKEEYIKKIQSTSNDTVYIRTLGAILGALQDGHTDLFPTLYYDPSSYKIAATQMPQYISWAKANEKDSVRAKYWSNILKSQTPKGMERRSVAEIKSFYSDTIMADKGIAIMNIPSFAGENVALDSLKIEQFLSNLQGANTLIINIQKNGGGSTHYWQEYIVPRLINDTIKYSLKIAIKKGAINQEYFYPYFESGSEISQEDPFYPNIPNHFLDGSFRIVKHNIQIPPNNPVDFNGSIYLLVDDAVFSAAESFTVFCQETGWAKVVGRQTSGDGIGRDPIVISLPNSGIKVRFVATAGFNADGSLNAEKGTTPDWLILGKTDRERLQNLIEKLTEK